MYVIQGITGIHKFATMEDAIKAADDYRARTGFLVGIEYHEYA